MPVPARGPGPLCVALWLTDAALCPRFHAPPPPPRKNTPQEVTESSRAAQALAAQEAFEEEHFTRLPTTRKDRALKRRRLEMSLEDELDALRDFADLTDYTAAAQRKAAADAGAAASGPAASGKAGKQAAKGAAKGHTSEDDDGGDDDDDDDDDGAAAYYDSIKSGKAQQKEAREVKARERAAAEADDDGDDGDDAPDGKRGATNAMLKNKGLTVRRKKEQRNPRVRRRMQYERAQQKLVSAGVRKATPAATSYGGEATGIKRNVARSVPLKS